MTPEILILCATKHEIAPLLEQSLIISEHHTKSNVPIITADFNGRKYILIITGPGVVNTAHALTAFLETRSVDLIVQTGIAGVFEDSGLIIGDMGVATVEKYLHAGVKSDGVQNDPLPFELIQNDPQTQEGVYSIDTNLCTKCYDLLSDKLSKEGATVGKGLMITVSSITAGKEYAQKVYAALSPIMEDMEGAGSAHVARLYNIPFIEARAASNYVGERNKKKWDLALSSKRVFQACAVILNNWR